MNRRQFHHHFQCPGPVILPVIHVLDETQTRRNLEIAHEAGACGVFLINHDFGVEQFLPILNAIGKTPTDTYLADMFLGVNFLAVTGRDAFPTLAELGQSDIQIDAYWADDARIDETQPPDQQDEASQIDRVRTASGWQGMYFGGTAFKKQRDVRPDDFQVSARIASRWMEVVTTSGTATGMAAPIAKIADFRNGCGDTPLAIASGVTPDNAHIYATEADAILVATGINLTDDFYNIDAGKLVDILAVAAEFPFINDLSTTTN